MKKGRSKGIRTREVMLPKGLTWKQAFEKVVKKRVGDWRGLKYDPKTGRAKVT